MPMQRRGHGGRGGFLVPSRWGHRRRRHGSGGLPMPSQRRHRHRRGGGVANLNFMLVLQ